MNKTQKLRNVFDKLFKVKTAVVLWVAHAILYGICLFFCYVHNSHIMMDIFGGMSWIVNIVAYVSSIGAIVRVLINKEIIIKKKVVSILLIIAVYFATTGALYLVFADNFKTEIEAGDWSEWTTEEDLKELEEPDWNGSE